MPVPPIKKLPQASASPIRGQTEEARSTVAQKPYYRKLITMKKQKVMFQMKGKNKIPEKQLNKVEIVNPPQKELRIMIVKMIQDLSEKKEAKIEKMQEMFTKDL